MPNPDGSKNIYLSKEVMEKFPALNSYVLSIFLLSLDEWAKMLKFKPEIREFLKKRPDIENAFKVLKVI